MVHGPQKKVNCFSAGMLKWLIPKNPLPSAANLPSTLNCSKSLCIQCNSTKRDHFVGPKDINVPYYFERSCTNSISLVASSGDKLEIRTSYVTKLEMILDSKLNQQGIAPYRHLPIKASI